MKRSCKTCTLNTTNDTIETCKRMCYLRYSKQRNKRICDLEQKIQNLKQTLTEIKEICKTNVCKHCHSKLKVDDNYCKNIKDCDCYKILQKISECEVENERN